MGTHFRDPVGKRRFLHVSQKVICDENGYGKYLPLPPSFWAILTHFQPQRTYRTHFHSPATQRVVGRRLLLPWVAKAATIQEEATNSMVEGIMNLYNYVR